MDDNLVQTTAWLWINDLKSTCSYKSRNSEYQFNIDQQNEARQENSFTTVKLTVFNTSVCNKLRSFQSPGALIHLGRWRPRRFPDAQRRHQLAICVVHPETSQPSLRRKHLELSFGGPWIYTQHTLHTTIWLDWCPLGLQEFLDATQKHYQADLKAVDFIGAPEECRAEINTWVEQQTESEIFWT